MASARHATLDRDRAVRRVLWIVLALNVAVAATKLVVGMTVGALSLIADGVHSALDGSSNVVGLIGLAMAARPPDRGHPYGHRRFEPVAAVVIGMLIAGSVLEIARRVVEGLLEGRDPPQVTWATVAVVLGTIGVNLGISRYEARRGRELGSAILHADSRHTLSDAMAAGAVLVGFGGVALGAAWADLAAAVVVSAFIARTAYMVLRANLGTLADEAQLDREAVHRVAAGVPGVRAVHRIRSRGPADHVHLDLHIHLDPGMRLVDAHARTHEVADALRAAFPRVADVIIHTEPAHEATDGAGQSQNTSSGSTSGRLP
jgi:cation diffusion facilitator family transporter